MRKSKVNSRLRKKVSALADSLKRINTSYVFILLSCLAFLILIYVFQGNGAWLTSKRAYQKNSAYAGIKSSFVTEQKWQLKSQREYPITVNPTVNEKLAQQIDEIHQAYADRLKNNSPKLIYEENTSFSVTYNRNQLLSISINSVQDSDNNTPIVLTKLQTFDLNTGQVVKLADIFNDPAKLNQRVLPDLRRLVEQEVQHIKPDFSPAILEGKVTPESFGDFMIHPDGTLQFDFTPGQSEAHYIGKLTLHLPATNYLPSIKPELANRMFDQAAIDLNSPESPKNRASFCSKNPCVALTFDDGPSSHTNRLLDILKAKNAKATFFILGKNAQSNPDIIKRQIEEGHQVGYHGWNHAAFTKLNPDQINNELDRTNEVLQPNNNYIPKVARPPYGLLNQRSIETLRQRNQDIILWSVDPRDWDIKDSNQIYNRVITASDNGAIILLHDLYASTIDSVEPIINYLQNSGYSLVTINTLLGDNSPSGNVFRRR